MILIKKFLISSGTLILILLIVIIVFFIQGNFDNKQSIPSQKETEVEEQEVIKEEDEEETGIEDVITQEDPIKEFLSKKVNKAIQRFFNRDLYVVSIGDSLTEGVGDEDQNGGYVGILEETVNKDEQYITIDNFGKRGNRTDQLLTRIVEEEEVITAVDKADMIFITIGANDITQVFKNNITDLTIDKFTSEQIRYEQRLNMIFNALQEINPDTTIYLIGFYNPFKEYFPDIDELEYIVNSWNQIGSDVTLKYEQIEFIPIKDLFEGSTSDMLADDNFHPNHLGYQAMAKRILNYVTNEGEENEPFPKRDE